MIFFADLPQIDKIFDGFIQSGYDWKFTRAALRQAAEYGISEWRKLLAKPEDRRATFFAHKLMPEIQILSETTRSIRFGATDKGSGLARIVEKGRPRYKIWDGMKNSPRLRQGKKGAYMIIAFRHGMAQVEHFGLKEQFKGLKEYTKTGSRSEKNAHGNIVQRNVYSYSSEGFGKRISIHGPMPGHKNHIMHGLTKAVQHVKGGGKHESALTFRVITARSPGWIYPAIKGQDVRKKLISQFTADPNFLDIVRRGVGEDMRASKGL